MKKLPCIGMPKDFYPEKRCIKTSSKYTYKNLKLLNMHSYMRKITSEKIGEEFVFNPLVDVNVDLYHSFNHICITKKKWVVTFETTVPRFINKLESQDGFPSDKYNKKTEKYLSKIAKENCLAVIAISKCSYNHQVSMLELYPKIKPLILSKLEVLYPPQILLVQPNDLIEKELECIELLFVGADFYRKGGAELVIAFSEALKEGLFCANSIRLTVVGDLSKKHNYALNEYQDNDDFHKKIEKIVQNNDSIRHFNSLSNDELLKMMKDSHVGILTTWADTFGYSVLEFQANGCPVITTNIRALPEINNPNIGWVIDIEKDFLGEAVINSLKGKEKSRAVIITRLKEIFVEISLDKEKVIEKGLLCLSKIDENHNLDRYNHRVETIYNRTTKM